MRASSWRDIYLTWVQNQVIGALTWAQTLANGNQSGGNDPTIDVGDRILWSGTRDGAAATQLVSEAVPAAPVLLTATAAINLDGVEASTGIGLTTGNATATGAGTVTSGALALSTGQTFEAGAGIAGASGLIAIATGANNGANPLGGGSGDLVLATGMSDLGGFSGDVSIATGFSRASSGQVSIRSGDSISGGAGANSGQVQVYTGEAYLGSGPLSIYTGLSATGTSGALSLSTGDGDSAGDVVLTGGLTNGAGAGAAISLRGGAAATGTGGPVQLNSGVGVGGKGRIEVGEPTSSIGVGQQAEQVYAPLSEVYEQGWDVQTATFVLRKSLGAPLCFAPVPMTPTQDTDWVVDATGGATVSISSSLGGQLIPAGGVGTYAVAIPATGSVWDTNLFTRAKRSFFRAVVIPDGSTDNRYEFGVRATPAAFNDTTDDNKLVFVFEPLVTGPNWWALRSEAGVDTLTDTGIPATAGTPYQMMVRVNDSNQGEFWISNPARGNRLQLVASGSVDAGLANLKPYCGVLGTGAAIGDEVIFCDPRIGGNRA